MQTFKMFIEKLARLILFFFFTIRACDINTCSVYSVQFRYFHTDRLSSNMGFHSRKEYWIFV